MEQRKPNDARLALSGQRRASSLGLELQGIGESSPILLQRSQLWMTGSDKSAALAAEIKHFDPAAYLQLVSALSTLRWSKPQFLAGALAKAGLHPRGVLRDYQLQYLIRLLLESSAEWNKGATPTPVEIAAHCDWMLNACCQADRDFLEADSDDAWPFLWRMAYQQFRDLEGEQGLLRSMLIYRELALAVAARHGYPIHDRFREITELDLDTFWLLSLALVGWFGGHPGRLVNAKELATWSAVLGQSEESFCRFLKFTSCTRTQFVDCLMSPGASRSGFEPYNLNPLLRWPLIRISDENYCAPIPRALLRRAGEGIYYDLMPNDQGRFGAVLGEAFQDYVGLILKGLSGVPELFPERKYGVRRHRLDTCDWVIVDGSTAVLIECKRSAINAMSKITGDRSLIRDDLCVENGVVDGVLKTIETQKAIQERRPGLEPFFEVETFYGLVVTLDDFYLPNSQMIREIVAKEVGRRGEAMGDYIQLTHVGGLEWLAGLLSHPSSSIGEVMRDKTGSTGQTEMDFKNYVNHYATVNFPGWHVTNWMPAFDDAYEELRATIPLKPGSAPKPSAPKQSHRLPTAGQY